MTQSLHIGGLSAELLARQYGTPLIALDLDLVRARIAELRSACDPHGISISYAGKAFLTVAFARLIESLGIGLDICSLGELAIAERAAFPPRRLTFHGAGKDEDELHAVAAGRTGRVIVDGIDELRELERIARTHVGRPPLEIVLRLNTGVEAHAHEFVRTAGDRTKFGFDEGLEQEAIALFRSNPGLQLSGLHGHIGSQIDLVEPFGLNVARLMEAAARFAAQGFPIRTLVAGGGFGIDAAGAPALELASVAKTLHQEAVEAATRLDIAEPALEIEPGRVIVAGAGTTLYRVMTVKRRSSRTFVIVDGGMADNPRPALYGAHHAVFADGVDGPMETMTVCGRSCENDEMVDMPLPSAIRRGTLLAMTTTGAYTYSMASNYNRFFRPAVVGVEGGRERVLARRETLDDLLSLDVTER
ncbi:MAG TPA: diaminopimelate decarboxylase [Candidatus Tumulicola sp.]|jgi:diaminopimelate decarboxylase